MIQIHLPAQPGTYLLIISLNTPLALQAGRLGHFQLAAGLYVYVGSAHGPGGLRARVGRHLRAEKSPHWHIDTLTARATVTAIWYTVSPERLECSWADRIKSTPGVTLPVKGFGSSDCACTAHLFALPETAVGAVWEALGQPCRLDV